MTISASPAGTPITYAVVQVTSINDNIGDALELNGFVDSKYNGTFKIIGVPDAKSVQIYNPNGIAGIYTARNDSRYPVAYLSAKSIGISSMVYTQSTGIVTVTTTNGNHGLLPGNTFRIVGLGTTSFLSLIHI